MTFGSPTLLAGLALVPILLGAYVVHERRVRARGRALVAPALAAAVTPRRAGWRRHVPVLGGLTALAILLTSLARPQTTVAVPVEQARVVIATDRSGSMQAKDVAPDRLTAARDAAIDFVDSVPDGVKIGAIAFNQAPTVLTSPTDDKQDVKDAIGSIEAAGTTATGDALAQAIKLLQGGGKAPSAIVLLSDGKSVRGSDVLTVARQAKAAKIPVYTVSLGTASGTITTKSGTSPVPPDTATMRQVAAITGGKAYMISDAEELSQVYQRLGSKLTKKDKKQDVANEFAGGALLVLLLGSLAGVRMTGRLV
ncbi:MAG TPA: VWA domain-containing protein [Baekduia sp.]|uniref:VWA domain-containing protein n=1 Tax=Baekduia sp. TaxID=2600305 RepID=UPI002D77962A|nr:VWA domain-containing protein [Baekduia sp.]HET6510251.1 VWA domain-containing protein [Baekduia sp.]